MWASESAGRDLTKDRGENWWDIRDKEKECGDSGMLGEEMEATHLGDVYSNRFY